MENQRVVMTGATGLIGRALSRRLIEQGCKKNRRMLPAKILQAGYRFQFPEVKAAMADLLRR